MRRCFDEAAWQGERGRARRAGVKPHTATTYMLAATSRRVPPKTGDVEEPEVDRWGRFGMFNERRTFGSDVVLGVEEFVRVQKKV